jgi:hypothetical protein
MTDDESISLDQVYFDEAGRAIISHPETVARLRRALLSKEAALKSVHCTPSPIDETATVAVTSGHIPAFNHVPISQSIPQIHGMTFSSPVLLRGIRLDAQNFKLATAQLRFASRQIFSLGPIVDTETPHDIGDQIERSDFAGQATFAGKPFLSAFNESTRVTRYVLQKLARACEHLFGPELKRDQLTASVSVYHKERYAQLQGAHIDWTKGTEFLDEEWDQRGSAPRRTNTLRSLETLHSVDCVLGGPPTDFFLDEQIATIHLNRQNDGRWVVSAISFANPGLPQPGLAGEVLFRPAYTVHQFPLPESWTSASKQRIFVSCDFYSPRLRSEL